MMKPTTNIDPVDLVTLEGFTNAFWKVYSEGGRCQEDVFWILDEIYFLRFGEHRFVSFDAFRMRRNRALRQRRKK